MLRAFVYRDQSFISTKSLVSKYITYVKEKGSASPESYDKAREMAALSNQCLEWYLHEIVSDSDLVKWTTTVILISYF